MVIGEFKCRSKNYLEKSGESVYHLKVSCGEVCRVLLVPQKQGSSCKAFKGEKQS